MTDVSGKPLNVMIDLFWNATTASDTSNSQYTQTKAPLTEAIAALPANLQSKLAGVQPALTTPLGLLFNSAWTPISLQQAADAAKTFQQKANGTGSSVSNVTCFLPPLGSVDAEVEATNPQTLFLNFLLPGALFHFNSGPLGAAWRINFDLALVTQTLVPTKPFGFAPSVSANLTNAQMHADNFGADLDEFFDDLVTDLGNFFTQSNQFVSDVDWDIQLAEQQTDGTQPVSAAAAKPLTSLFTQLNKTSSDCAQLGFTQCAFSIVNHQLTLTVTHPLDPGPKVEDSNNLPPPFFKIPATLSADSSQAVPGTLVHLSGDNFPVDTSTQLDLQWDNTTSGAPTAAQIRYNGTTYPVPMQAGFNGTYMYTTAALPPGKAVSFEARCGDELTWSKWSDAFVAATATTGLADIKLVPAQGNPSSQSFDLGTSPLSKTSSNFADAVTIPAGVPDGAYNLVASTAGQQIAETPIMIVSILAPTVDIIDPSTNIVEDSPIYGGLPFTLRGEAFPDGPVTVAIDGTTVATPTAVGGKFIVPLTTPGNQWTVGVFPLTATSGAEVATLDPPLFLEGAPK